MKHTLHIYLLMKMEQSVPKRRYIKFRRRGITQKKSYNELNKVSDHKLEIPLLNLKFHVSCNADSRLHETRMSSLVSYRYFMSVLTLVSS